MKKILMNDETLFKNIEVFDNNFIPEEFIYRDNQLNALSMCIKPALRGHKPSNALLLGGTATGKTTSVKLIFSELKDHANKLIPVYVNCQIYNTKYKIFSEIHKKIFGFSPPPSGLPLSELFDKIFSYISKNKKVLLMALDDCEIIFDKSNSTIYDILRGYELYDGAKSSVWCITHKNLMHLLDDKTRSIYNPDSIEYYKYTQKELVEILSKRAECGLYDNIISTELIELIAEKCFDIRYGIEYMRKVVLLAESESSKIVTKKHLMKVLAS